MQNNKISVIIPIYNVEKYVEECLNSVINQTYKNLEILCVDDCGNDNSIKVVEEIAKKDERIKILSYGENKGVSFARNYGIEKASGDYIYFIDSDDFIEKNYINDLYEEIKKNDVDVIINTNAISYDKILNNQFFNVKLPLGKIEINNDTIYKLPTSVWCKLYKKSFLDRINVKFPLNLRFEDEFFHYATLVNTDFVYIIHKTSYFYRQIKSSFMNREKYKTFDMLFITKLIFEYYKENNLLDKYNLNITLIKRNLFINKNKNELFKLVKNFFIQIKKDVEKHKNLYLKKNLLFFYCILSSKNYYLFKLKYFLSKIFKMNIKL